MTQFEAPCRPPLTSVCEPERPKLRARDFFAPIFVPFRPISCFLCDVNNAQVPSAAQSAIEEKDEDDDDNEDVAQLSDGDDDDDGAAVTLARSPG